MRRATKFAEVNGTTVAALIIEHLVTTCGRRRTIREQIYRDHVPHPDVVALLEAEWRADDKGE